MNQQNIIPTIQTALETVLFQIVDHPSDASIKITQGEQTTVYEVHVNPLDRGKVIGKKGLMAQSLRHILTSMAAKNRIRAILEICD